MQKLVYVPPGGDFNDAQKRVILTAEEPFILSTVKGLGGVEANLLTVNVVGMNGCYYQGSRTAPRQIPCTVYIRGKNREDMYRQRCKLIGLLTPTSELGTLYYTNDYISVKISAIPSLPPDFTERIKNYNKADITFFCPFPYWTSLQTFHKSIGYVEGVGFTLPFQFPISFGMLKNEISIDYRGTSPAPVKITIVGPAISPTLTNTKTGKTIGLTNKAIENGEKLVINTERGNKSVKLISNNVITDAFQYIDPKSVFWELEPGINRFVYSSADNEELTYMNISYSERYSGV